MKKNAALHRLRQGETLYGFNVTIGSPEIADYTAHLPFDWVMIDWQHGTWTEERLINALSVFTNADPAPVVRVRGHNGYEVGRMLDLGAMGVIVPMVNTPEEAERMARTARYTPAGDRSAGGVRLPLLAEDMDSQDYFDHANDEVMVVVQIETVRAVERAEEILGVPGVDAVFVGPGDLLMDVKAHGGGEKDFRRSVDRIARFSRDTGTAAGYACGGLAMAKDLKERGYRLLTVHVDSAFLKTGMKEMAEAVREW